MSLPVFHHLPALPYINTHHPSPHRQRHTTVTHQARASTTATPKPQARASFATAAWPEAVAALTTTPTPQAPATIPVPAWPQAVAALTPLPRYDLHTPATPLVHLHNHTHRIVGYCSFTDLHCAWLAAPLCPSRHPPAWLLPVTPLDIGNR
ncbi:hypothetical protein Pcinc_016944 [Petrolisthes cinctipes]|uniref:Uncharacterized protein n=1 Tax=Petrolisthes cinctipes TaxID=88211 RepID=A0AAE1FRM4_PETCI|nr:hypothetical protein Pcinc_016944 [Petrolisthes cinctipes]